MTEDEWTNLLVDLVEKNFPKGKCKERGNANVLVAEISIELKKRGLIKQP